MKLEKFLDPKGVRSDLLEQFRKRTREHRADAAELRASRTRRSSSRAGALLRFIRKLLQPILKLFFNPNPLIEALHIQATAERHR